MSRVMMLFAVAAGAVVGAQLFRSIESARRPESVEENRQTAKILEFKPRP